MRAATCATMVGDSRRWVSTWLKRVCESFPRRVRLPVAGDERPLRDVVPHLALA